MSNKSKNKRVEICLIVAATCVVVTGLWAVLATPETAFAAKPGSIPVCIEFEAGGGIQSDDGAYCDDKQLKVEAKMTPDGHVNLIPNTGRGSRTLYVDVDFDPGNAGVNVISTEGWRFLLGGWNETFDMRAMEIGVPNEYVNLLINTEVQDNAPAGAEGENWRLIFGPYNRWDGTGSTCITVTRTGEDTWEIQNITNDENGQTIPSLAVLNVETKVKNRSTFESYGIVTVPPFTAIVTLAP